MTFLYPVFLDIRGKPCLIIGGGAVACRKAKTLIESGAALKAVAPFFHPGIRKLEKEGRIKCFRRKFAPSDLEGAALVVCATDDEKLNSLSALGGREKGVLVNVADRAALCNFIVPAVFRNGDLTIAVSTGGASPALAKRIRLELRKRYGGAFRKKISSLRGLRLKMLSSKSKKDKPMAVTLACRGPLALSATVPHKGNAYQAARRAYFSRLRGL